MCLQQQLLPQLLLLQLCFRPCMGRVTGVWTDIESSGHIVGEYLRNATAEAHKARLRFAVDAQVGWAIEQNAVDPHRPVHEQVMDIVDEVTLMDYFTGCNVALSTATTHCDPTMALFWLGPWLAYANFLLAAKNRTVLIDIGVGMDPKNVTTGSPNYPNNHWISSELDLVALLPKLALQRSTPGGSSSCIVPLRCYCYALAACSVPQELFFQRSTALITSLQGEGPTSGDPGMLPPFMKSWCTSDTTNETACTHSRGPFHNFVSCSPHRCLHLRAACMLLARLK